MERQECVFGFEWAVEKHNNCCITIAHWIWLCYLFAFYADSQLSAADVFSFGRFLASGNDPLVHIFGGIIYHGILYRYWAQKFSSLHLAIYGIPLKYLHVDSKWNMKYESSTASCTSKLKCAVYFFLNMRCLETIPWQLTVVYKAHVFDLSASLCSQLNVYFIYLPP